MPLNNDYAPLEWWLGLSPAARADRARARGLDPAAAASDYAITDLPRIRLLYAVEHCKRCGQERTWYTRGGVRQYFCRTCEKY